MLPPFLMPTAREHSSCLEASRAAALAAHSAAGLAAAAGLREAARLLRSCEALARAATAALQSTTTSASPGPLGATAVAGQATHAPAARRRKRNKKSVLVVPLWRPRSLPRWPALSRRWLRPSCLVLRLRVWAHSR